MPAEDAGENKTILIVDDDPEVRRLVGTVLSSAGYKTVEAASGLHALSLARQAGSGIGAVVTDITMPDIDGVTLAERLAERFPEIPVVFMSGFGEIPLPRLAGLDIRWGFVPKPFRVNRLLEAVRSVLAETGGARAA